MTPPRMTNRWRERGRGSLDELPWSKGTDHFEASALEDVVRPVDADVVDVVLAVAQLGDAVDDSPRVSSQRGFRCLVGRGPTDDRSRPRAQLAGIWSTCFAVVVSPFLKGMTFVVAFALEPTCSQRRPAWP